MAKTAIEDWRIPLPPVQLQCQFAANAEAVRTIATQQAAALANLDALLHQAIATA